MREQEIRSILEQKKMSENNVMLFILYSILEELREIRLRLREKL